MTTFHPNVHFSVGGFLSAPSRGELRVAGLQGHVPVAGCLLDIVVQQGPEKSEDEGRTLSRNSTSALKFKLLSDSTIF